MITEQDLQAAIAECQGERNPNANTCIKLAAFYTIKRELFGSTEQSEPGGNHDRLERAESAYSYAPPPDHKPYEISLDSGTEFAQVIEGRDPEEIMPLMDEAMSLLQVVYPKCYDAIMNKLR